MQVKGLKLSILSTKVLYALLQSGKRVEAILGIMTAAAMNVKSQWSTAETQATLAHLDPSSSGDILTLVAVLLEWWSAQDSAAYCRKHHLEERIMQSLKRHALRSLTALKGTVNDIPRGQPAKIEQVPYTAETSNMLRQYIAHALSEVSVVKRYQDRRVTDPSGAVGEMEWRSMAAAEGQYFIYGNRYVTTIPTGPASGSTVTIYTLLTPIPATKQLDDLFAEVNVEERIYNRMTPHLRDVLLSCNLSQLQVLEKEFNVTIELQPDPTELKVRVFIAYFIPAFIHCLAVQGARTQTRTSSRLRPLGGILCQPQPRMGTFQAHRAYNSGRQCAGLRRRGCLRAAADWSRLPSIAGIKHPQSLPLPSAQAAW